MWYGDIICNLDKTKTYTRQELYQVLMQEKSDFSLNSFKWILPKLEKNGIIYRIQRGLYMISDDLISDKRAYQPHMSERMKELCNMIETRFPLVEFVCFDSVQFNEFLNHLIANNTHFIMVEKAALDSVFRYLQEEKVGNILFKPGLKEWDAYWRRDTIVMLNLISEAPKCSDGSHGISIEQLLVDVVAEKSFKALYSTSEIQQIYDYANEHYLVDHARLLRYAGRRGKTEVVKKFMERYMNA